MSLTKEEQGSKVDQITTIWLQEYDIWQNVYDELDQGWNFIGGKQYTQDQIDYYAKKKRPTNVFNNYLPIFVQVAGLFLQAQSRIKAHPTRSGDPFAAARIEDLLNHYERNADTLDELSNMLISGMIRIGWIRPEWSDEYEIDGSLICQSVDAFDMLFDSRARKSTAGDAKYQIRSRWMEPGDIKRIWSHRKNDIETAITVRDAGDQWMDDFDADTRKNIKNGEYYHRGQYRVLEYHEMVWEPVEVAVDSATGEAEILTVKGRRRELFLKTNPQLKIVEQNRKVKKITECVPGLRLFLDHYECDIQDGVFDNIPYWSYTLGRDTIDNFGLDRLLRGPQKQLNDMENVSLDMWNKQAAPGEAIKPDAIKNYQEFMQHGHEPGFRREIQHNYAIGDAFQQIKAPSFPASGIQFADRYREWMHISSGARQNFMGTAETGNENASLFAQRVQEAEKSNILSLRNYQRVRRHLAQKQLKILQNNLTLEKYFLITEEVQSTPQDIMQNAQTAEKVLFDIKNGEYNIVMDDVELNPTARRARWMEKVQFVRDFIMPAFGAAGVPWEDLLRSSDFEDADKMIEHLMSLMQQQGEESEETKAIGMTDKLLDMAKKKQDLEFTDGLPAQNGLYSEYMNDNETVVSPA